MLSRYGFRVTLLTCVAFIVAAAGARGSSDVQACYIVTDEDEVCPQCPGFSSCLCLYEGAPCPGYDIMCFFRKKVEPGGIYGILTQPFKCYRSRPCTYQYGYPCHPLWNPCVKTGYPSLYYSVKYEQDTEPLCA